MRSVRERPSGVTARTRAPGSSLAKTTCLMLFFVNFVIFVVIPETAFRRFGEVRADE